MRIFRRHPDARAKDRLEAELAYYGLAAWWSALFSGAERARIGTLFQARVAARRTKQPTTENNASDFRNAAALLVALAGCLRSEPQDRDLAMHVLSKAEERAKAQDDVLALHLVYQDMIRLHCHWRERFADALNLIFGACHKQIAIAPAVAAALRQRRPDDALPTHMGFQVIASLLEQEVSYAQAIELCKQARTQGWDGNWTWRIGTLARKLAERGDPVRQVSTSGLSPL